MRHSLPAAADAHAPLPPPFTIRDATPDDLAAILAMTNREIAENVAHFGTRPITLGEFRAAFDAEMPRFPWLVAASTDPDNDVLAYCRASPWKTREAYQWTTEIGVYVAPHAQGRGLGRALYAALFPRLEANAFRCVIAGIALPNDASVRLHEAFDMTHAGTLPRVGFKHGQWRDVGYWTKLLGDPASPPTFPPGSPTL